MLKTATPILRKTPSRAKPKGRKIEAALAAGLLLSFFMPWVYSLGTPLKIPEIRARLAGPHRLLSVFTGGGSRISNDYHLSLGLYAIPAVAILLLLLIAFRRYTAWAGLLAGAIALIGWYFLRGEVASFPFHRMAMGSYVALTAGCGLAASPLLRYLTR
jgi:hypothetical protein